jgi:hypothetical protein
MAVNAKKNSGIKDNSRKLIVKIELYMSNRERKKAEELFKYSISK